MKEDRSAAHASIGDQNVSREYRRTSYVSIDCERRGTIQLIFGVRASRDENIEEREYAHPYYLRRLICTCRISPSNTGRARQILKGNAREWAVLVEIRRYVLIFAFSIVRRNPAPQKREAKYNKYPPQCKKIRPRWKPILFRMVKICIRNYP